jgi:hypothetical protein
MAADLAAHAHLRSAGGAAHYVGVYGCGGRGEDGVKVHVHHARAPLVGAPQPARQRDARLHGEPLQSERGRRILQYRTCSTKFYHHASKKVVRMV